MTVAHLGGIRRRLPDEFRDLVRETRHDDPRRHAHDERHTDVHDSNGRREPDVTLASAQLERATDELDER